MLVLSRKNAESIVVGGSNGFEHVLKITVLEIRNGSVKLGLDVNREVPVHREEVWERIRVHDAHIGMKGGASRLRDEPA